MKHAVLQGARRRGFSLIELLVAMAIGLVVTLSITSIMIRSEQTKRTHTTVNDLDQTGTYVAFALDRAIRSAGAGFSQSWSTVFGCLLDVSQPSAHLLPFPAAIPSTSAFTRVTATTLPIRMAPVVIAQGLADSTSPAQVRGDILMVMSGTGGGAEVSQPVKTGQVTNSAVQLQSALGYETDDLVLLADPTVTGGCMVQQVGARTVSDPSANLPMAGTSYYAANGTNVVLTSFGVSTIALQLGNVANLPQFQLYGVGASNVLASLDLLKPVSTDTQIADGVVEMRALYGLDASTPSNGVMDQWVAPTGAYAAAALMNGTAASRVLLRQIVAIRIGLILRTPLQEQKPVIGTGSSPLSLTLFSDLSDASGTSLAYTRTYAGGTTDLNYRYRTVEVTVPLRNVLIAPQ